MLRLIVMLLMLCAAAKASRDLVERGSKGQCSQVICDVTWCLVNRPPPTKAAFDNRIGCMLNTPEIAVLGNDCGTSTDGFIRPLPAAMHSAVDCPIHETGTKKGVIYQTQYTIWRSRTMPQSEMIYDQLWKPNDIKPISAYCRISNFYVHCDKGTDVSECTKAYKCDDVDGDHYGKKGPPPSPASRPAHA